MTGLGTVLLGCLLPALLRAWHASDGAGGFLMAAQFAGSACGALLTGRRVLRSAMAGYGGLAGASLLLVSLLRIPALPVGAKGLLFFCFGLGLGCAMTATSLLVGMLYREARGSALALLNAAWTLGAASGPVVAGLWVRRANAVWIFFPFAVAAGASAYALLRSRMATRRADEERAVRGVRMPALLTAFVLLGFLYVGVEASVSGWMVTLVHREASVWSAGWAAAVASCFWISLLAGRLLTPAALRAVSEQQLLRGMVLAALLALAWMLAVKAPVLILAAAALCGVSLGPVFPLCVSRFLELSGESPRTRYLFSVAGIGGAALPWVTGVVSSGAHSLRVGLEVPLAALGLMGMLVMFYPMESVEEPTSQTRRAKPTSQTRDVGHPLL